MSQPEVSIVSPCLNEIGYIDALLSSIAAQEPSDDYDGWEAIIADGGSVDGTRERLLAAQERDPRIRLIDNRARSVSAGLNAAIREARGEIIVRMDAHTEYAPDYVKECVRALKATGAANVGGPARTKASGYLQRAVAAAYHSPFSVGGARFHNVDYEGELDTVVYGCWTKATLLEIGLFDESLVRNQDDELNFRLVLAGKRLWQTPKIRSWYWPRGSFSALFRQYQQYGYWKVRVMRKHGRTASLRHLLPCAFVTGLALGWTLGWIHPAFLWVYLIVCGLYGLMSLGFSAKAAAKHGWDLFPVLPLVFLIYHVSYGLGFTLGLWDAFVLRKRDRKGMAALSRSVEPIQARMED